MANRPGPQGLNARKAVCLAAELGHLDIVKMFAEVRVDLNSLSYLKKTPLYCAIESGQVEVACYLSDRFEVNVNVGCES